MNTKTIPDYEVSFSGEQRTAILTFDMADVGLSPEALGDPKSLVLSVDHVQVDFDSIRLLFPGLPDVIHAEINAQAGMWVCGLGGDPVAPQVAAELPINRP